MRKRTLKKRLERLEANPADLPTVGLPTRFELLDHEWTWVDQEYRVLSVDGDLYHDKHGFLEGER